jgi:RHH-type proline utilization regulon transcriptional repressor/proline dehydrogenase/delta 1-pyrroline-5-carboxylate dehydrogenase
VASTESETELAARLAALSPHAEFLRTLRTPSDALLTAAYAAGLNWINAPMLACGRHELPRWLREQAVSRTMHRYGLIAEPVG